MSLFSHSRVFDSRYQVYLEEIDLQGVVYHVNYLKYLDRARADYLLSLGFPVQTMIMEQGINLVVSSLTINYLRSAQLGDEVRVRTRTENIRGASMIFEQEIWNQDLSICFAKASVKLACVDSKFKPIPMPIELKRGLESGR